MNESTKYFLYLALALLLVIFFYTVGKAIFYDIPRKIIYKKYTLVERKHAKVYFGIGVLLIFISLIVSTALSFLFVALDEKKAILAIGAAVVGVAFLMEGVGVLLFKSKEAGLLGAIEDTHQSRGNRGHPLKSKHDGCPRSKKETPHRAKNVGVPANTAYRWRFTPKPRAQETKT